MDNRSRTATAIAAEVGDQSVFTLLFDGSLDEGLVFAAVGGYGALIRHLIGARASVEAREDGRTALNNPNLGERCRPSNNTQKKERSFQTGARERTFQERPKNKMLKRFEKEGHRKVLRE